MNIRILYFSLLFSLFMCLPSFAGEMRVYTELSGNAIFKKGYKLTGIDVDVVREIMQRVGTDAQVEVVPWKRGYQALLHESDVALFPTTLTKEREPLFHWIGPLLRVKWVLLAKKGSGIQINALEDAKKVSGIGTYEADARERFLVAQQFKNLVSTNNNVINMKKLHQGRLDLVITSNLGIKTVSELAGLSPNDFEAVHTVREVDLYLALSKATDQTVVDAWRAAFESMKADGTFQRMYRALQPLDDPPLVPLPAQ